MGRVPVRHTNDLQTVYFHLLIDEHAHPSGRNGMQIFAVIPKLLVIAGDERSAESSSAVPSETLQPSSGTPSKSAKPRMVGTLVASNER